MECSLGSLEFFFSFDLIIFAAYSLDILPGVPFGAALGTGLVAEEIGGVEDRHASDAVPFTPLAPDFGDTDGFFLEKSFDRRSTRQEDNLRLDEANLFQEIGAASFHFVFSGLSVAGRATFDDVTDKDFFFREFDGGKNLIEELASFSDEGFPLEIFILSRSFSDDQDIGLGITSADDGIDAGTA